MIVFDSSYPGLVLSLHDVEFSSGSRCPEVPLNSFALTFSVSRGRFRIFTSRCPDVASFRFVILSCERGLGVHMLL